MAYLQVVSLQHWFCPSEEVGDETSSRLKQNVNDVVKYLGKKASADNANEYYLYMSTIASEYIKIDTADTLTITNPSELTQNTQYFYIDDATTPYFTPFGSF